MRHVRTSAAARWIARWWRGRYPSLEDFIARLVPLAAQHRFEDMLAVVNRHPRLQRRAQRQLRTEHPEVNAIRAAELIAKGWIGVDVFRDPIARRWMMPLLRHSSGRYVSKIEIAQYLVRHLDETAEPADLVKAVEDGVTPLSRTDYSNFRSVFSLHTWPILRRHLTHPRLVSELDIYVTGADRISFWNEFCRLGGEHET